VAAIVITSSSIDRLLRAGDGDVVHRRRRADLQAHSDGRGQHRGTRIHHAEAAPLAVGVLLITAIEAAFGGASMP
jgi:hypothetical protein